MMAACALLQLLLGNIGRPGGGIMALHNHASSQGSLDLATVSHRIHGYLPALSAWKKHATIRDYLATEAITSGSWANKPKFFVSYLKSMYGAAATAANDFGYDWHPKIIDDHSYLPMFMAMAEGRVQGMFCIGQNPANPSHAHRERKGLRQLEWLVVKDCWMTETATFWQTAPEITSGEVKMEDIQTEVFFFPSAQIAETEGSFTNTERLIQWHYKAADAPGDSRSDAWFTYQLGKRLKKLYADSKKSRDEGVHNLVWDYELDQPKSLTDEPDVKKILREINGYVTDDPSQHLEGIHQLHDDGSTTCASWLYCGVFPAPDRNLAACKESLPPGDEGAYSHWGYSWPGNHRLLYNRASTDLQGQPWSARKRWIWWDGQRWVGYDLPDGTLEGLPPTSDEPTGTPMWRRG